MPVPKKNPIAEGKRVLLRDVVEEQIREAIMDGTLEPGESLNDKALQDWLGVSRTPIRDALNELTRAGFIEMEPNRYTRVATPKPEETLEAMQTLGVLLGGVVRLAVTRLSDAERDEVLAILRRSRAQLRDGKFPEARRTVLGMWNLLAAQCGNSLLLKVYTDTAAGLMFKLPGEYFTSMFAGAELEALMDDLDAAIAGGESVAAELATEKLFKLP
ncbi:GntR family transcriptional regulator [Leucobacter japonicus]|uniref:GntR family transcriptional regulator n=1 Tax=Leucobacter japonicus TaxID=1461259 RepID=UPI0006A7738A|nr:GntR family transcriptional regulator [Leucobacter japonicus]